MDPAALRAIAEPRYDAFVEGLRAMVDVDCGSYTPDGVNRIADLCEERFRAGGWSVDRRSHAPADGEQQLGDLVIGTLEGAGGPAILLVGHTDTVFDEGTVAERPFRIEDGRALGPGVSDMKGGLLVGFAAVEVLREAGFDGFGRITYVCNPDEEIGSPFSGPVIREMAPRFDAAFVLEGARENGDVVSSRKGITDYVIAIEGRAAHAGVEPERGRNAILQAAHTTIALQALNGRWPGVTVNVGVIHGGTRTNVVAERCELHVDLRSPEAATLDEAAAEVERICATRDVPDVTTTVHANGWHRRARAVRGSRRSRPRSRASWASPCGMPRPAGPRTPTPSRRPARRRSTGWGPWAATTTRRRSGSSCRASCHACRCWRGS